METEHPKFTHPPLCMWTRGLSGLAGWLPTWGAAGSGGDCVKATASPTERAFMAKPVMKTWLFLVALEHNEAEEKRQAFGFLASPVANESSAASQDTQVLMNSTCRIYGGIWR